MASEIATMIHRERPPAAVAADDAPAACAENESAIGTLDNREPGVYRFTRLPAAVNANYAAQVDTERALWQAAACPYAALGTDGCWHLLGDDGATIACGHVPVRPRRKRVGVEAMPDTPLRLAVTVPYQERCVYVGHTLEWPGPARRHIEVVDMPSPWPDRRPPLWHIWSVLYPVQQYRCAMCRYRPPHCVDHDHATGLVRGLLCHWCNGEDDQAAFAAYCAGSPASVYGWQHPKAGEIQRRERRKAEKARSVGT